MSEDRWNDGLQMRTRVLGAEYVGAQTSDESDIFRPLQELVTEYCWGAAWGDETLEPRTRSMLNLTMIAALNRMHEWELHFRGALRNGVTLPELKAIITQITIYCGVPAGVECHRIANRVLAEDGLA